MNAPGHNQLLVARQRVRGCLRTRPLPGAGHHGFGVLCKVDLTSIESTVLSYSMIAGLNSNAGVGGQNFFGEDQFPSGGPRPGTYTRVPAQ
jgi:hypothetical protein